MLFLANPLLTPDLGLIVWTSLFFLLLWFVLGKKAWNPIVNALKDRENKIEGALHEAQKAREEMAALQADHEKLLQQAKEERAAILKEAKQLKDKIIAEARDKAQAEYAAKVASAKEEIQNQKMAAIVDVKNLIGTTAIELAKGVLTRDLGNQTSQEKFIEQEIKKINLN